MLILLTLVLCVQQWCCRDSGGENSGRNDYWVDMVPLQPICMFCCGIDIRRAHTQQGLKYNIGINNVIRAIVMWIE